MPAPYKWQEFRPLNDWVVVKADKRKTETKGGIVLPEKELMAERVTEGTGTILKVGPTTKKTIGVMLEPGERICFRGFLKDVFHEFEPEEGCIVFMLRAVDVLMTIDQGVDVGIFS